VDVHDWTDDMLRNAIAHTHNLSISGGSEKTKFVTICPIVLES
jgi:hypothetical protein